MGFGIGMYSGPTGGGRRCGNSLPQPISQIAPTSTSAIRTSLRTILSIILPASCKIRLRVPKETPPLTKPMVHVDPEKSAWAVLPEQPAAAAVETVSRSPSARLPQ